MDAGRARRNERARSPNKRNDRRIEPRIPVSRRATLLDGTTALSCFVDEFSTRGLVVVADREFFVGEILELKCELYPDRLLMCKVEIRHIDDTRLGTHILEIDEDGTALLDQFLQEHYSLS